MIWYLIRLNSVFCRIATPPVSFLQRIKQTDNGHLVFAIFYNIESMTMTVRVD